MSCGPVTARSLSDAAPFARPHDGPDKRDELAREVEGDEKAIWWERAVAAYPPCADYQKKTTREIPVFVPTPMET